MASVLAAGIFFLAVIVVSILMMFGVLDDGRGRYDDTAEHNDGEEWD